MTQRDCMREIWSSVGHNEDEAIKEYVRCEENGTVDRKSNDSGLTAEQYAKALLKDGLKKGWL